MDEIEVWIPSKTWVRKELTEDLKSILKVSNSKRYSFLQWLKDNDAALDYVGKERLLQIISEIAADFELVYAEEFGYVKKD